MSWLGNLLCKLGIHSFQIVDMRRLAYGSIHYKYLCRRCGHEEEETIPYD